MSLACSLATKVRPTKLTDFVGQQHLLGIHSVLFNSIKNGQINSSMVFWGPPGTGKTSLALLISKLVKAPFIGFSAVDSGISDIRKAIKDNVSKGKLVLFIDEIHRYNKNQQDVLLPLIEQGDIILIGATTENPSFELNPALLSRVLIYVFNRLTVDELKELINKVIFAPESELGKLELLIDEQAINYLAHVADGDARKCLNLLEECVSFAINYSNKNIDLNVIAKIINQPLSHFDKYREEFYNLISALHKSVRGSDPDASLYWFTRLMKGGCAPQYISRRLLRMAIEDIGNADPNACKIVLNAWDVYERLGSPEGDLSLAQATIYLACTHKSNTCYEAYEKASKHVDKTGSLPVPKHLRNAPTNLMKKLGYGKNYQYPHDFIGGYVKGVKYFPDDMEPEIYYNPTDRGYEKKIQEFLKKRV